MVGFGSLTLRNRYTLTHGAQCMRSFRVSSDLALILVSSMLLVQPAIGANAQTSAHRTAQRTSSVRIGTAPAASSVEVINGTLTETQVFNARGPIASPVPATSPSAGTSVEVLNGAARRTVVLDTRPPTRLPKAAYKRGGKRLGGGEATTAPPVTTVETINGTFREIKVLNGAADEASGARRSTRPVVVGIVSSDTKRAGGNRQRVVIGIGSSASKSMNAKPVVVGVASSESENVGKNAQPVAVGIGSSGLRSENRPAVVIGVAPQAKRRPYEP